MCLWIVQNNLDPVPEENSFEDMQENGDKIYLNAEDEISKDTAEKLQDGEDSDETYNNEHMNVAKDFEDDQPDVLDVDHLPVSPPINRASSLKSEKSIHHETFARITIHLGYKFFNSSSHSMASSPSLMTPLTRT